MEYTKANTQISSDEKFSSKLNLKLRFYSLENCFHCPWRLKGLR
jgi:hypothetical protein